MYRYCAEHNIAYWNWYRIMGGEASSLKMLKKGLIQKDKLHLTRRGYELQGQLLYEALLNAIQQ